MQLMDVTIAFAFTLAALATVVTVIIEAGMRCARLRKRNLVEVMKLINEILAQEPFALNDTDRWDFFHRTVENRASARPIVEGALQLVPKATWDGLSTEERLLIFGREKSAGLPTHKRLWNLLKYVHIDPMRSGMYENVSLEYMLRCLASTRGMQDKFTLPSDVESLSRALNRIARKYEQYTSSVSSTYKHYAQGWSILVGILLAMFANIDGVRIFESFMFNPSLTAAIVNKVETDDNDLSDIVTKLYSAQEMGIPIGWPSIFPKTMDKASGKRSVAGQPQVGDAIAKTFSESVQKLPQLIWGTILKQGGPFLWLLKVVLTGILIGLGAPFWFDVAKRLSQIRKGAKESASKEFRMAQKDANGDVEKRRDIVKCVIDEMFSFQPGQVSNGTDHQVFEKGNT